MLVMVIQWYPTSNLQPPTNFQVMAQYARHRAADTRFASPFAYGAYQAGIRYMGGKMDDITVIVAIIELPKPQSPQSQPSITSKL